MRRCSIIITALMFLSVGFPLGTQALNIPMTARSLALAGSGIGGAEDPYANPAAIYNQQHAALGFSHNNWIGDISGNQVSLFWGEKRPLLLTLQSWSLDGIQLWGDVPDTEPPGTFSSNWIAASFTTGFSLKGSKVGLTLRNSLSKLYTNSTSAITLDGGVTKALGKRFSVGAVIKNIGTISGSLKQSLPLSLGVGMTYQKPGTRFHLAADLSFDDAHGGVFNCGLTKGWTHFDLLAGLLVSPDQTRLSSGFSFRYRRFEVVYGVAFHDNSFLGVPQFLDIRLML